MADNALVDRFGRAHDYLRISVTDRCNLRCVYCMPEEGMQFSPNERILSFEEIVEIVMVLAKNGIRKLRLTGGEPLVRKDLDILIAMLSEIPGIEDIALSTNGIFLAQYADRLKKAGLARVNISLDSLHPERYAMITRGGDLSRVLSGITASRLAGLNPIKLNVVLMKGVNDDEVADFLRMTLKESIHVRFIEYMPISMDGDRWKSGYAPLEFIWDLCQKMNWKVAECSDESGSGPARSYRVEGAAGTFGLIHPVSDHFCGGCNRLRLTADGNLKPCLYWSDEFNVRKHIGNAAAMETVVYKALHAKPENHEMALALLGKTQTCTPTARSMSQIGG